LLPKILCDHIVFKGDGGIVVASVVWPWWLYVWPSGRQFYGATESYWVEIVGGTVPGGDGFDRI